MATIYVGSARHDENGRINSGAAGDQKQTSNTFDTTGEVSMQKMYTHSKGWYILRPIAPGTAEKLAQAMIKACNNSNIGYDQYQRYGVVNNGILSEVKTEADCSSLVRACIKYATGKDVGDFTTGNCVQVLVASGLFQNVGGYSSQSATPVFNGDVLCTKTKGHVVIVVQGNSRVVSNKPTIAVPTVKNGSRGTQATYLQQDLNYLDNAGLVVDGKFGPKSVEALKKWQAQNKLTVDGIYGKNSYNVMIRLLS